MGFSWQDAVGLSMHCWARYLLIAVVAVLGVGQMISACGQKGDLYLPDPRKEQARSEVTDSDAEAATPASKGEDRAPNARELAGSDVPRPIQQ